MSVVRGKYNFRTAEFCFHNPIGFENQTKCTLHFSQRLTCARTYRQCLCVSNQLTQPTAGHQK